MVIPLWGKIAALSLAKKITVLIVAKLYGIPRLYRRSQKLVRYAARSPQQRQLWAGYVRSAYRLPEKVVNRWHGRTAKANGSQTRTVSLTQNHGEDKKMYSFAASPLIASSRARMASQLRKGRSRLRRAHARIKARGSQMRQDSVQQLQHLRFRMQALAAPAPADAATMQFLRQARQAYQFVPAIASGA